MPREWQDEKTVVAEGNYRLIPLMTMPSFLSDKCSNVNYRLAVLGTVIKSCACVFICNQFSSTLAYHLPPTLRLLFIIERERNSHACLD